MASNRRLQKVLFIIKIPGPLKIQRISKLVVRNSLMIQIGFLSHYALGNEQCRHLCRTDNTNGKI